MNAVPLEVEGVQRAFGDTRVLVDVTFSVAAGTLYGLIGRNGAGKTTTIESIVGLARPDAGRIAIFGNVPRANRRAVGHAPQEIAVYPDLTARENIAFFADLYGNRNPGARAEAVLEHVGLAAQRDQIASLLSGGQRRLLNLALALAHEPPLLILDEPTVGLDIEAREGVWRVMREARARGTTILLTTHYLEEADRLCDRIGILDSGRITIEGAPRELIASLGYQTLVTIESPECSRVLEMLADISIMSRTDDRSVTIGIAGTITIERLVERLGPTPVNAIATRAAALEDVYLGASLR